jgi:tetratricopeptide (TPR) repeat protein
VSITDTGRIFSISNPIKEEARMINRRLYIDGNDDLWVFFEDENSYIDGPFLYCFDRQDFKFKKQIRLFTSAGRQPMSHSPLFAGQDSKGRFVLGSELGHLAKISQTGWQLFHKVLMEHKYLTTHGSKYKRPYFVRNVRREKRQEEKNRRIGQIHILSMAMAENLIFIGQGCRCCPNDILVLNEDGNLLYHFPFAVGPQALCARDGKLYLADYYTNFIHVTDFKGKWIESLDVLGSARRLEDYYDLKQGLLQRTWGPVPDSNNEKDEDYYMSTMCSLGSADLAVAMTHGSILLLGEHGEIKRKIESPEGSMYPVSIAADSSGGIYVGYLDNEFSDDFVGIYQMREGEISGPFLSGDLGIFESKETYLKDKIANFGAIAFDYFDLADIRLRKDNLSQETVEYLRKAVSLKPDFWLAVAYLGLTLNKMGDVSEGVAFMEKAFPKILCPVLAAEILIHYYRAGNKEKAMSYYRALEKIDGEVEMEFYSEKISTEEIKKFLGKKGRVKKQFSSFS